MANRRWVGMLVLAGLLVREAAAQDWTGVERLKRGTTVLVESQTVRVGPPLLDRCRVEHVDATTLTCKAPGWGGTRLVYPQASVDAVYQVKPEFPFFATVGAVGGILLIASALASSGATAGVGLIFLIVALVGSQVSDTSSAIRAGFRYSAAPPDVAHEKHVLVYERVWTPAAAAGASIP